MKLKKSDLFLNIAKIAIIAFVSFYLLGNFIPFYEGHNPYFYGVVSVNFSNGIFSVTNELLQETGRSEFIGNNWLKTDNNTFVPISGTGLSAIGGLFYLIGGYYGLFYLSPIFAILLLIFSDRIATNLFGKYVGFLTLLFLATSNLLLRNSVVLLTESVFSVFFILGCFYLVKYLRSRSDYNLLLSSIFFVVSTSIRINGAIAFPVEMLIVGGYFLARTVKDEKLKFSNNNRVGHYSILFLKLMKKKTLKTSVMIFIPWFIFFVSYLIYQDYYFGDPLANYGSIAEFEEYETSTSALITFETEDFENIKQYSKYLLPYQLPATYNRSDQNFDDILGDNWLGIISLVVLSSTLVLSIYTKNHRIEMIVFFLLIASTVWFYSSITTEERAERGVAGRYMIPIFSLSSMMIAYLIQKILAAGNEATTFFRKVTRNLKFPLVGVLIIFFIGAFYFSPSVQAFKNEGWKFNDPREFASRYPLNPEGLSEKSVILAVQTEFAIDYGAIPFELSTPKSWDDEKLELLKKVLDDGYEVFVFKEPTSGVEKDTLKFLIKEHGIVLREYSASFCEVDIREKNSETSDQICLG